MDTEATHNAMTCEDKLRCGRCHQYKAMDAFGKRRAAIVRGGRDFVCRQCRSHDYDDDKRLRLSDIMSL
jgi:hypothetical protein